MKRHWMLVASEIDQEESRFNGGFMVISWGLMGGLMGFNGDFMFFL